MILNPVPTIPAADEPDGHDTELPVVRQPQSLFLRRLPVMLYRLGFGPLLGVMPFLILTTRGRSGQMRYTPLEYRRHGSRIYVLATAKSAGWFKRICEDNLVTVRIGMRAFPAKADVVTDEAEAIRALFQFRMNAPVPLRWIYWSGRNRGIVQVDQFRNAARRYTFVRLEPLISHGEVNPAVGFAVPPVPADRAWMTVLAVSLVSLLILWKRSR